MKKSEPARSWRLSPAAQDFLDTIAITLRGSTRNGYGSTLVDFHSFHEKRDLNELSRSDIVRWLRFLKSRNLAATTRVHKIFQLRTYLRWLHETDRLRSDPDFLIRSSDLPSLPKYLPRPLPPEVDRELQERLSRSTDIYKLGLLLMRLTGLRIGELIALEHYCLHSDSKGFHYLKVPLGKLNTERMVPLDEKTLELARIIQKRTQARIGRDGRLTRATRLLVDSDGRSLRYYKFAETLDEVTSDISLPEKITSHRLRHTYATSLLNAGMSLIGLMKLLGHKDFRMTLRYAAVTQHTVKEEYFSAIRKIETRYFAPPTSTISDGAFDPRHAIEELLHWIRNDPSLPALERTRLAKRLQRIDQELPGRRDEK